MMQQDVILTQPLLLHHERAAHVQKNPQNTAMHMPPAVDS